MDPCAPRLSQFEFATSSRVQGKLFVEGPADNSAAVTGLSSNGKETSFSYGAAGSIWGPVEGVVISPAVTAKSRIHEISISVPGSVSHYRMTFYPVNSTGNGVGDPFEVRCHHSFVPSLPIRRTATPFQLNPMVVPCPPRGSQFDLELNCNGIVADYPEYSSVIWPFIIGGCVLMIGVGLAFWYFIKYSDNSPYSSKVSRSMLLCVHEMSMHAHLTTVSQSHPFGCSCTVCRRKLTRPMKLQTVKITKYDRSGKEVGSFDVDAIMTTSIMRSAEDKDGKQTGSQYKDVYAMPAPAVVKGLYYGGASGRDARMQHRTDRAAKHTVRARPDHNHCMTL